MPVADKYAQMVGDADYLVHATTSKFSDRIQDRWVELPINCISISQKKKETLLEEFRSTSVIGACSQDSKPINHQVNTALLSAETFNWEAFLKAPLDIMNDRFEQVSDASYAWEKEIHTLKSLKNSISMSPI